MTPIMRIILLLKEVKLSKQLLYIYADISRQENQLVFSLLLVPLISFLMN